MIYEIVKENNVIGKGTFGKIYYHPKSYPNYIVKKIKKYNDIGNNLILNNIKELWWYNLLKDNFDINDIENINFKNVPQFISYNVDSDFIYLLLEHRGTSLYNKINEILSIKSDKNYKNDNEKVSEYNINKNLHIELLKNIPIIMYSCSKVLLQLHYASMRHGDLTIPNIIIKEQLNSEPLVSVIDWGSFVFNKTINSMYNQCAPECLSPELQIEPKYNCSTNKCLENLISIKSDIYSLGLVILYLLEPTGSFKNSIDKYISDSEINDYQHIIIENILNSIKLKYDYISEHVDERIFFLLSKMLENNIETRIDIDTLFMDELFTKYRIKEKKFNKFTLRNILKKDNSFKVDSFKNLFVNYTYDFLKKYKTKHFKPLLDTRIILLPSVKLFYNYLTTSNIINSTNFTNLNETNYKNHINQITFKLSNINHYIISFLCCMKWIDILINDDISVYHLYEYYITLYKLFSNHFSESLILDIINFLTMFDLTFFLIFTKTKIFTYPDIMDFKYEYISHSDIKKLMLSSEIF
jgi:hypothetical protein